MFGNRENNLRPLALIGALVPLTAGTGALAHGVQDIRLAPPDQSESFSQPDLSFRNSELVAPDGSRRQRRSIIAGVEVAPDTTIGVGLFDTLPRARGTGADPRLDARSKRSRKAAVGLSLRF